MAIPRTSEPQVCRPFHYVMFVICTFLPDAYLDEAFKVIRRSFYNSPEITAESWHNGQRFLVKVFENEGVNSEESPETYPLWAKMIAKIYADQLNWELYMLYRMPTSLLHFSNFKESILLNRQNLVHQNIITPASVVGQINM
jgi:hypothetical protein